MNFEKQGSSIVMTDFTSFNIAQILECGQCFRFYRTSPMEYDLIAKNKVLHIKQYAEKVVFTPCTESEFTDIWIPYFDLETDYDAIKEYLGQRDEKIKNAVAYGEGIRLLNQDRLETIISFIISQNKNIPGIKLILERLTEGYGEKLGQYYSFPALDVLAGMTEKDFLDLGTGFRAKYLVDAAAKIKSGELDIEREADTDSLRESLMKVKGIGPKVSNCIMLFSFGKRESFPVDVWIKRAMEMLYFPQGASNEEIERFAAEHFGCYGGYAQQYLFYYARSS